MRLAININSTLFSTLNNDLKLSEPYAVDKNNTFKRTITNTLISFIEANLIGLPVTLK